ncbi:MAG: molybdopterin-dependent oxidoreductase [Chromatiales bacterium]|jgi:formate dehydrogenase|nr:molybdopterin-dependent oxidoreductase [Chromatiales bacterium]
MSDWQPTACILCSINCGIEVRLGGEDERRFVKIRGDKAHPSSKGYLCQKASKLDHYQNGKDRITRPMRRRDDGSFEEIDWETAIAEIAAKLGHIRDEHGGEKIFYYGGGGQANHLPGTYAASTLTALGSVYRSNALAQEKTGEFWVQGKMFGAPVHPCFDDCEVAFFLGKNPWQSHGFPRSRFVLNEIAKDPARKMIVVDPVRTETADKADIHLQLKPGTDAWLMSALAALFVQEGWFDAAWMEEHTRDFEQLRSVLGSVPVARYCEIAGVDEAIVREAGETLRDAGSVSFMEDLGIQMNRHSTLVSYLNRLMWLLTSSFGKSGGMNVFNPISGLGVHTGKPPKFSPVNNAKIIYGLVPCNVIPEEILTDHADRYRAMIIESANPAHSLADTPKWREALAALDLVVTIDVAMTETARHSDYVLPTPTQYEKWECSFFNLEPEENTFQLRRPLLSPPQGVLGEPEIHTRLVEALGAMPHDLVESLRQTLEKDGREAFAYQLLTTVRKQPEIMNLVPVILYRTLGPTLPDDAAAAAPLWALAHFFAQRHPTSMNRAGYEGEGPILGEQLFEAIMAGASGVVFSVDDPESSWQRLGTEEKKINAAIPVLLEELAGLSKETGDRDPAYPLILSAGERRDFTANTLYRDPQWRRRDFDGALRISPQDAGRLGLSNGGHARITTHRASAEVVVEVSDRMQAGHVSLPNGQGLDNTSEDGGLERVGVAPNELTSLDQRDWLAGTPWHKWVPAKLETVQPD